MTKHFIYHTKNFKLKKRNILIAGLAMAIGWGIRGNFGHQYGAAFAGCLATITACLLSRREDWHKRVLYFGFFGAIGWGFGATVSYMQVISYTESGHAATQWFGYTGLFIIGFLWAALGVAAAALVAAADTEVLPKLFKVILFVFGAWLILDMIEDPLANLLQPSVAFDDTGSRQRNPLYWLDANYLPPSFALLGACFYDLVERKNRNALFLPLFMLAGFLAGWLAQYLLGIAGWDNELASLLTFRLGDLSYTDPVTGLPAYQSEDLLTNWPQWFSDYPYAVCMFIGTITGIIFYFIRYGKFRNGSSLVVYMAGGWLIFFLAFPVLGSLFFTNYGGIRMTPPRSDDWAGILGVFAGTIIWLRKNNFLPVATSSIVGGTIGGLGFSGIQWIKQLMMAPGNPRILQSKGIMPGSTLYENSITSWSNWQYQNWHSFLEQSYGFTNGLAIVIGLGLITKQLNAKPEISELKFPRWMMGISAVFILLVIPYVNLVKNVKTWGETLKPEIWTQTTTEGEKMPAAWDIPYIGHLPNMSLHLTPEGWFNLTWILILIFFIALIRRHFKQPLTFVPASWLGKGQLILLLLLWTMVSGNFERELTQWTPQRLLTEWVITANAIILTYCILIIRSDTSYKFETGLSISFKRAWIYAIAAMIISAPAFLFTNRLIYQYDPKEVLDTRRFHLRFGPDADWRARPILKTQEHK